MSCPVPVMAAPASSETAITNPTCAKASVGGTHDVSNKNITLNAWQLLEAGEIEEMWRGEETWKEMLGTWLEMWSQKEACSARVEENTSKGAGVSQG